MEHGNEWIPSVLFGADPLWVSTIILLATYGAVISEKINRAVIALVFSCLLIVLGVLNQDAAVRAVDFNTIGLLIGMMIIVSITKRCGLFQYLAIWSAKKVSASPAGILIMLQIVTAVVSAFLDNVTTVLLVVPVTLVITEELDVDPFPFLATQVIASNIGGTATLIGDPPNILIGSWVGIPFNAFVVNLAPIVVVLQALACVWFHLVWGRKLHATTAAREKVMRFNEVAAISDYRLMYQTLAVIGLVIVGFVTSSLHGLQPATLALFGAAVLMLIYCFGHNSEEQSDRVQSIFNEVEWITIFFFVGLFIVVAGVEHAGLLKLAANKLVEVTGGDFGVLALTIMWASAFLSAIIDNIPFVATMIPMIENLAPAFGGEDAIMPLWWALSLGACLGGNGTLVGASANLTVAGLANRSGIPFSFVQYTKYAFPHMVFSVFICMIYFYLRYLA